MIQDINQNCRIMVSSSCSILTVGVVLGLLNVDSKTVNFRLLR